MYVWMENVHLLIQIYIYTYIYCMYIYIYIHIHIHIDIYIYICVCVERLNRRKASLAAHVYILYIIHFIKAGDHRGPGGVGDQRRHLPGTRVSVPAGLWWCTWAHLSRR